ncbi:MAG TPA: acyl-CoA dehydrogenase family protein [Acidimicrobiia bacterium]|jgi:alkylation response protein AidB-like acyl-CoA dehydrogenase
MDFGIVELAPDVIAFWDTEVVPFMEEFLSDEVLEQERHHGNGFVPEYRRALGAKGWLANATSNGDDDTVGLDPLRAAIVAAEESRRARSLFPVLGSNDLVTTVVNQFGSAELREHIGPGLRRGDIHCCLGYTEPDCGSDAAAIRTRAIRDGDEWVINGQKMFSTGAHLCQYVMVTARTNPDASKHQSITVLLVPLEHPGVEVQGIATLGGERTNFVYLDEARVADEYRLGPVDQGWQVASGSLAAEHGMSDGSATHSDVDQTTVDVIEALGRSLSWRDEFPVVLAAAERWARNAQRRDRSYEIDDPAVRLRLARIALDCEVARITPDPYGRVVASDLLIRGTDELLAMIGAAGVVTAGEDGAVADGVLEWAHRFAQGTSIYGGTTDIQRNLIAEHVLGLPRHRGALKR